MLLVCIVLTIALTISVYKMTDLSNDITCLNSSNQHLTRQIKEIKERDHLVIRAKTTLLGQNSTKEERQSKALKENRKNTKRSMDANTEIDFLIANEEWDILMNIYRSFANIPQCQPENLGRLRDHFFFIIKSRLVPSDLTALVWFNENLKLEQHHIRQLYPFLKKNILHLSLKNLLTLLQMGVSTGDWDISPESPKSLLTQFQQIDKLRLLSSFDRKNRSAYLSSNEDIISPQNRPTNLGFYDPFGDFDDDSNKTAKGRC